MQPYRATPLVMGGPDDRQQRSSAEPERLPRSALSLSSWHCSPTSPWIRRAFRLTEGAPPACCPRRASPWGQSPSPSSRILAWCVRFCTFFYWYLLIYAWISKASFLLAALVFGVYVTFLRSGLPVAVWASRSIRMRPSTSKLRAAVDHKLRGRIPNDA